MYIYNLYKKLSSDSKSPISKNYFNSKILNSSIIDYIIASHNECNNSFDVCSTSYLNIPKNLDIFTYSFPCQDLSIQGKQRGMSKESKSRSSLLWEIERIFIDLSKNYSIKEMPKYLLMENVSQVAHKKNINELKAWEKQLDNLGYKSKLYILNAKDFGLPQNRVRAFLLSINKDWLIKTNFIFPDFSNIKKTKNIKDILSNDISSDLFLKRLDKYETSSLTITKSNIQKKSLINYTNFNCENYIYNTYGIGPTLTATGANSRIKIFDDKNRIRYLSNLENFLYMGFDEDDYKTIVDC
ncbi:MAG: DNA cytosine methyltransferase, partial [Ureaplasma sp.]|nr:DNA cytosine methyltransferase [Ureaplasma sp.]